MFPLNLFLNSLYILDINPLSESGEDFLLIVSLGIRRLSVPYPQMSISNMEHTTTLETNKDQRTTEAGAAGHRRHEVGNSQGDKEKVRG